MSIYIGDTDHKRLVKTLFDEARAISEFHQKFYELVDSEFPLLDSAVDAIIDALRVVTPECFVGTDFWYEDITDTATFEEFWNKYYENNEERMF